ncbi:protein dpy-30 homolog [Scaptodrosophila lebanonensis]|uniref:Protein dpy-30 homolog n=1 Tax=Drosophila lebanonensis TaxID=7225 RepID=A0A6J2TC27_DROLE|nr:protein dpy-30 homolog [Scaptodrosophila lebanonensis]XP_030372517.1 protein dpy-30 homolog [Scaptodrosophila lebanonensis]
MPGLDKQENLSAAALGGGGDRVKDILSPQPQAFGSGAFMPGPLPFASCRKPRPDHNSLPVRQYLDQTVAPLLLHGLQALARERPADPISYLATYLLKNKNRCDEINAETI